MLKLAQSAAVLIAAGTLVAGSASAASLSFVEQTTGSGSLNGTSFTNALVTFTGAGDTNDITLLAAGVYAIVGIPVSVNVAGVGSDTFTDAVQLVSNQNQSDVGIGDSVINQAILFATVTNAGYDLSTSFGPVSGPALLNPGLSFGTTNGSFDLTFVDTTTYQATVGPVTSPAPEPAAWAFMLVGFAAIGSAARARRTKSARAA
jgi:hypothetical protein